ncbi:MAG TPA: coproporphyrinogen III oxidase family protein, partial [Balneolaceae bacterium]|nr:coproporphyrinogen III oxidase family protein [Balneolaceae bacterium]
RITPPEDDTVAEHFELINERLSAEDIHRYEVSNYSRPGAEAVHNSNYWRHENYLGFGPGAHSFWWYEQPCRWKNASDLGAYLQGTGGENDREQLTMNQLAEERIMMGLRTREGLSIRMLNDMYNYRLNKAQKDYLNRQEQKNMLQFGEKIQLTNKGILLADAITLDLLTLHEKSEQNTDPA